MATAKPKCPYCNDTGMISCRSRDGLFAFAGCVPDGARGYFDADCWYCDSGKPLADTPSREARLEAALRVCLGAIDRWHADPDAGLPSKSWHWWAEARDALNETLTLA